jgi:hypothetical protein
MKTSLLSPYAAYLRVYEPLAAFREPARSAWEAYAAGSGVPNRVAALAAEHRSGLVNLLARPPVPVPPQESEHAFVLSLDATVLVCPWQSRLRCWAALAEFRDGLPDPVVECFLPRLVVEQAESDYDVWQRANPELVPHILTSTWHVPLRWFVLFEPGERVLELGAGEPMGRTLLYRTPMVHARRRVARGLRTLQRTVEDGPVVAGVEDLGRWLEAFHPRSLVELDYGGIVQLLDEDALTSDDSAADVAEALRALAAGEPMPAAEAYERLMRRWRAVQAFEHAN